MRKLFFVATCALVAIVACSSSSSSDPPATPSTNDGGTTADGGGNNPTDSSVAQDSATKDTGADTSTTPNGSTDPTKPIALAVGVPFSGKLPSNASGSEHFFEFTVPTTGKYTFTLTSDPKVQVAACTAPGGCLCQIGPGATCCIIAAAATSCTFEDTDLGQPLAAGTKVYPSVY
jgi:hypothetical protein